MAQILYTATLACLISVGVVVTAAIIYEVIVEPIVRRSRK